MHAAHFAMFLFKLLTLNKIWGFFLTAPQHPTKLLWRQEFILFFYAFPSQSLHLTFRALQLFFPRATSKNISEVFSSSYFEILINPLSHLSHPFFLIKERKQIKETWTSKNAMVKSYQKLFSSCSIFLFSVNCITTIPHISLLVINFPHWRHP